MNYRRIAFAIWIVAGTLFLLGLQTDPFTAAMVNVVVILLFSVLLKLKAKRRSLQ